MCELRVFFYSVLLLGSTGIIIHNDSFLLNMEQDFWPYFKIIVIDSFVCSFFG